MDRDRGRPPLDYKTSSQLRRGPSKERDADADGPVEEGERADDQTDSDEVATEHLRGDERGTGRCSDWRAVTSPCQPTADRDGTEGARMEEPPITSTERDPGIGWVLPPPKSSSADRPPWAIPTLIVGFGCSLIVGVVSLQYSKGQMNGDSPSLAMAYAFMLGPFLLAGVPLMLIGSLATIRPWSTRMRWLRWVASAVVVLWFGLLLQGPGLLFQKPISRGTATVGGLPGHAATWSGAVDCIWARGVVDKAVAIVPAMPPGGGEGFELTVWPTRDDPYLMVWVGESGRQTETDTIEQTSDGAQGSITTEAGPLLDIDGLRSVITMTWDCGRAPTG